MTVDIYFDTSRLDALIRGLDGRAGSEVDEAGQDLLAVVQSVIREMGLVRTGRMLESATWKVTKSASGVHSGVVSVGAKSDEGFPYPIAIHEGWTDRGGGWHRGNPFMRVAAERFKPYFRRNYFSSLFD